MTNITCDRCGTAMKRMTFFPLFTSNDGARLKLPVGDQNHMIEAKNNDLCRPCLVSLMDWFHGGKGRSPGS